MGDVIAVNKPIGLTPLQAINKFKQMNPAFTHTKMSYAGRLDPLAHGILLLVYMDEIKQKEEYLALHKEYEFKLIFGLQTDTYDMLGYVQDIKSKGTETNVNLFVNKFVNTYLGKHIQFYPPYSSKTVYGKPLFWWAKNNKLHEITIPQREIEIYDFRYLEKGKMSIKILEKQVFNAISLVEGDFRQKEISKRWRQVFTNKLNQNKTFTTAQFKISCSNGTYIRELVNQMGKQIGCGAIAIDILRTKVGDYLLKDALNL